MDIRIKLVELRKQRRIKQIDVAGHIGITATALSRFEKGKSDLKFKHIEKYVEFLGLEIKFLLK